MADLILHGGTVLTMDEATGAATSVLVRGGRIEAVGGDEILKQRDAGTEVIDLAGRTACPGFIDAHHHLALAAWYQRGANLAGCQSKQEALQRIAALTSKNMGGDWIYAYNYRPRYFANRKSLSRYDLDDLGERRPIIVMHFSFHEGVISSTGLRAAGIDSHSRDPEGGRIVRDKTGEPTGELLETAIGPVEGLARGASAGTGYEDWVTALETYGKGLLASGITHVCDPGLDGMMETYLRRAKQEGRLPVPVDLLFASRKGLFQPPTDRFDGPVTGDEVDGLRVGPLKLFADGGSRCAVCTGLMESLWGVVALVGRAARSRKPALLTQGVTPDRPRLRHDGRLEIGFLHYDREQLTSVCEEAQRKGFDLAVHAACNAGIDAVLAAYESLPRNSHRNRVEHLVSLDVKQAQRLGNLGAIGVVQPAYVSHMGDEWESLPAPRRLHSVPLRDLLDAGVTLAGSSDAPIAPYSPLLGMQAAMTRQTAEGLIHQGDQGISALEALRLWTTGGALAANLAGQIGVLRSGARADIAVLSRNPLDTPSDSWTSIRVERTLIEGKTVFSAAELKGEAPSEAASSWR